MYSKFTPYAFSINWYVDFSQKKDNMSAAATSEKLGFRSLVRGVSPLTVDEFHCISFPGFSKLVATESQLSYIS